MKRWNILNTKEMRCTAKNSPRAGILRSAKRQLALLLAMCLLFTSHAFAASPSIVNISVGNTGNVVTVDAALVDGFNESMLEAIESGVPISFTYEVELRQIVPLWMDSLVSKATVKNSVQYDTLNKVYSFSSAGKNIKRKVITRDKALYQKLMLSLDHLPIASTYKLSMSEKYYVRIKASLETDRFWFPFNYIFFFVPFNDVKTSWSESSPLRLPDPTYSEEAKETHHESVSSEVLNHVVRSFNQ